MQTPCDEAVMRSGVDSRPCAPESGPWILAAAILGTSMAFIDSTVVNVALPALQSTFKATVMDVQWVVESYGLLLGALILVGGAAGDLFGRRKIFLSGVALFALASIACGLAQSIEQLIAARAVQGLGAALLTPGSLAIISASFSKEERGRAIGTWSGFSAITTAFGPVLGGWLIQHASWRWIFFINVPIAAAVVVISLWHVPESRSAEAKRLDYVGAMMVTVGLGALIYGLIESPLLAWGNPKVFGSLIVGGLCLLAFPFVESSTASPMVPLKLFRSHTFSGANFLTLLMYGALGIFFFIFPMNLIQVQGYSATAAGAAALPLILLMFFLSRWSGGLVARYGSRLPLVIGPIIASAGFALFAVPSIGGSYWTTFFPAFLILGFGLSISVAPLTTSVMGAVDQNHAGAASGINNAVARVAGLLAIAGFGIVMVQAFVVRLDHELSLIEVAQQVHDEVQSNRSKLAGIDIPRDVDPNQVREFKADVSDAFVFAFRVIACSCAVLALASALVASVLIEGKSGANRQTSKPFTAAAD